MSYGIEHGEKHWTCEPSNSVKNTKGSQVGDEAHDKENLQHCKE
jgi:hypothetical protein